ncbi:MAG: PqqD family protein [Bauldia sp.]
MHASAILTFAAHASFQSVGDGAVVLLADSGQLYTCNETTEAFLQKVDGNRPLQEIVGLFTAEFEVDPATAESDLASLADTLVAEGILQVR